MLHAEERAERKTELKSYPPSLQLEPTTRCTQNCPICARNYYDKSENPPTDMQMWVLEKIEPAIEMANEITLGGYGEPLIAENIWRMVRFLKERDCKVEIITGVIPLKSEKVKKLLMESGVDKVRLSIDGINDDTLMTLRKISTSEIAPALQAVSEIAKNSAIEFSINFTANLLNIAELKELVSRASDWGVKKIFVLFQKIYARSQAQLNAFLDPERVKKELKTAQKRADELKIELAVPDINRREIECSQPLDFLFIRADGEVLGCCSAVFKKNIWRLPVGNLKDADIMDLWNSPILQQFRKAFYGDTDNYPEQCKLCAFRVLSVESYYRFLDDLK